MALEIDLLGRFAVRRDGRQVAGREFGGRIAQRLVRVLVTRRGEVLTRDALIDSLWGEHPPADPEGNLNVLVNRARRGLGDPAVIETVPGGYVFSAAPEVSVDVEHFETTLRDARRQREAGAAAAALAEVQRARAMWCGGPLPEDAYADWAQPHRDRLEHGYQELLETGAGAALEASEPELACDLAAEAVSRQPLREPAHLLRIRALAAVGDTAGALAAFEALRRRLADELGLDPSQEAGEMQRRLLRGEALAGTPATTSPGPVRSLPVFVGRDREMTALLGLGSSRHVGLVAGRSGSGKSRLLAEVASRGDRRVLAARAVLPERAAAWSLARILLREVVDVGVTPGAVLGPPSLAALGDLLPDLPQDASAQVVDAQSRQALALEAAVRLVAAAGRVLVVVDDLQWADSSSLDLLAAAAGRAEDAVWLLAYRPEEVPGGQDVARFLADLRATTAPLELTLAPLTRPDIDGLVGNGELAELLVRVTDGTPFAIVEVLRSLEQQGALRRDHGRWRTTGPGTLDRATVAAQAGQRRSIAARAGRQPALSRELLSVLAVLGRPAPVGLLSEATGAGTVEVGAGLDLLARSDLVRCDERGWDVAHDRVGETLRDLLGAAESTHVHQLLARSLQGERGTAGERARHLVGAGDRVAAAATYASAARQQLDRYADREAGWLAQEGLDLGPGDPTRARLLEVRAESRSRSGDLSGARDDLRAAFAIHGSGAARSRLLTRLAVLASGAEDLVRASTLTDLALTEAGTDPLGRAPALAAAAVVDMNLDRPGRAQARYAEALSLFEEVGDARGVVDVLDARAMATFLDGDITAALEAFDRVAGLFADAGDLLRVVTPRSTRGHGLVFAAMPEAGLTDTEAALELARWLGNPEGEAYAQWHRSEALSACDRVAEGMVAAEETLAIARRLGHRGWQATGLRALGVARQAEGDLGGAEDAFRGSLALSAHLPLFACWAHARLSLVLVAAGRCDEAAGHVEQAMGTGPPLGHYEARLAGCELAVRRRSPGAAGLVAGAAAYAARGGHRASLPRLAALRDLVEV